MLNGTEILVGLALVVALVVMSVIDVAFANASKVSVRRLVDRPRARAAPALAAMLETRPEVLTSIHVVIQLILVIGSVFVFSAFQMRTSATVSAIAAVVVMIGVILVFRHLLPRIL